MARPRLPRLKAEVSGATLTHPGRFKNRRGPKHTQPVGEPYANMTDAQKSVWLEMAGEMPWLHSSHRTLLRLVCNLVARMDSDAGLGVAATHALSSMLSKLGATPVDAARVSASVEDEDDPDEAFFATRN